MSFIAVPPTSPTEATITAGPFLPALDVAATRAAMRIDGTVTPERLRAALVEGIAHVADQLADHIEGWQATGYTTLGDVPVRGLQEIDGLPANVHRYLRAVRCWASAELIERMRDYDSTNEGHLNAEKLATTVDDLRRDARWAINDISGRARNTVELI